MSNEPSLLTNRGLESSSGDKSSLDSPRRTSKSILKGALAASAVATSDNNATELSLIYVEKKKRKEIRWKEYIYSNCL